MALDICATLQTKRSAARHDSNFHPLYFHGCSQRSDRFALFAFKRLAMVDKWGRYYRTIDCQAEGIALLAPAKPANLLTSRAPIQERAGKRRTIGPATCLYKRIPCSPCLPVLSPCSSSSFFVSSPILFPFCSLSVFVWLISSETPVNLLVLWEPTKPIKCMLSL